MAAYDDADTALLLTLGKVARNGATLEFLTQTLLRELLELPYAVANALLPDDMSGTLMQLRRVGNLVDLSEHQVETINAWAQKVSTAWSGRSVVVHSQWAVSSCSEDLVRIQRRRGRPHEVQAWTLGRLEEVAVALADAAYASMDVWKAMGWADAPLEDTL